MKYFILSLLLGVTICLAGCASDIRIGWNTPASQIALDRSIPGAGVSGRCDEYARALQDRFIAAGIPCSRVGFHYTLTPENKGSRRYKGAKDDAHAGVVYEDNGRFYWKDNQHRWPIWIHDGTNESVLNTLGPDYTNAEIEATPHTNL